MYASNGVGLAAPQINKAIRLFVVDSAQMFEASEDTAEEFDDAPGIKEVFINPQILQLDGVEWDYEEGCLSIPKIREDVSRPELVTIKYFNENFEEKTVTYSGLSARIIQHEYDHIEGKLFIDYLKPLKRKLLKSKLDDITKGKVRVDYKMSFPK
jgi:peptide deformylase